MFFLGCDGGSTKTEWIICDHTGTLMAHYITSGINYLYLGNEALCKMITSSVIHLLETASLKAEDIFAVMAGLTAYGEAPGLDILYKKTFHKLLPNAVIQLANDSVAGWSGSLAGEPGINVVAGTGAVAYGCDNLNNGARCGGWSLIFGDEGSCSWIERELVAEFFKQSDGRHKRTALYGIVKSNFNIDTDLFFPAMLQEKVFKDSAVLAGLQLTALSAAENGDENVRGIYRRAAESLAEMVFALQRKLSFSEETPVRVSYSGGLFRAGEIITRPFFQIMEEQDFKLIKPEYSPIIGTVIYSMKTNINNTDVRRMADKLNKQLKCLCDN